MKKISGQDAKQLLALTDKLQAPVQADIDRAKVAAMTCKSSKDFCEFLELDPLRFNIWCKNYPSYRKAVWAWRDVATNEIEVAMAKRAIGFKKTTRRDVVTKTGQVETLINETYYPPDTAAAQFWLKNRAPNDWQDKKEIDVNLNANIRAWLVSAGGQLDPSEIIDGVSSVIEPLIAAELEDSTQSILEANLMAELEAETSGQIEEVFDFNLVVNKDDQSPDADASSSNTIAPETPKPAPGSPYAGFNSKWD